MNTYWNLPLLIATLLLVIGLNQASAQSVVLFNNDTIRGSSISYEGNEVIVKDENGIGKAIRNDLINGTISSEGVYLPVVSANKAMANIQEADHAKVIILDKPMDEGIMRAFTVNEKDVSGMDYEIAYDGREDYAKHMAAKIGAAVIYLSREVIALVGTTNFTITYYVPTITDADMIRLKDILTTKKVMFKGFSEEHEEGFEYNNYFLKTWVNYMDKPFTMTGERFYVEGMDDSPQEIKLTPPDNFEWNSYRINKKGKEKYGPMRYLKVYDVTDNQIILFDQFMRYFFEYE